LVDGFGEFGLAGFEDCCELSLEFITAPIIGEWCKAMRVLTGFLRRSWLLGHAGRWRKKTIAVFLLLTEDVVG
jgi:hypothetical protein